MTVAQTRRLLLPPMALLGIYNVTKSALKLLPRPPATTAAEVSARHLFFQSSKMIRGQPINLRARQRPSAAPPSRGAALRTTRPLGVSRGSNFVALSRTNLFRPGH